VLKSAQKCAIFTVRMKKNSLGKGMAPSPDPTFIVFPQFAPSSQDLWIHHCRVMTGVGIVLVWKGLQCYCSWTVGARVSSSANVTRAVSYR